MCTKKSFSVQAFRPSLIALLFSLASVPQAVAQEPANNLPLAEVRTLAKEAYIYGFPLVDNYRIQHSYFVDRTSKEYKAPFNTLYNNARVYTPSDKAIQTPNSDTPYSYVGADLRAEPLVFSLPEIAKERYFSLQFIDMYTHNFAYLGSRATGNGAGHYLLAGPAWKGQTPAGINRVIHCETEFAFILFRTQLFNPADLDQVKAIQAQYKVQPLSAFLGRPAAPPQQAISFPKPLSPDAQKSSLEFFNLLNFVLQACPTDPSENELRTRFAKIGVSPGKPFEPDQLTAEATTAFEAGIADAWTEFAKLKEQIDAGKITSGDLFGTREFLKNNYLYRMAGALLGIYGNSKAEAMYPAYFVDAAGNRLNGAEATYTLHFAADQLPLVQAFWSLTLYELPSSLLHANPINRYLINSPMLPDLKRDADGGLTLHIQHESPGKDLESNWLPAPAGPFFAVLRLYRPNETALTGTWKQPPLAPIAQSDITTKVTPETYIRAESDRTFQNISKMAGGVNKWFTIRKPTPLDQQTVVRMNLDTLYSASIVDTENSATVTVPTLPDARFMSVLLVDNDHYAPAVFYKPGTYQLPQDTKYLAVVVRIQLFNPKSAEEVALVNSYQDMVKITSRSADPFPTLKWDLPSLKALTEQYEKESRVLNNWKGMMGPRGSVDEKNRHLAAAAAWGLNPEQDATYLNYNKPTDPTQGSKATFQVPENQAFWSITVYGNDGYMKNEKVIVNSSNVKLNDDGTFTVYFGSTEQCGDVPNRVDVTEGWNYIMRIYRPGPSVLDGTYKVPTVVPVK